MDRILTPPTQPPLPPPPAVLFLSFTHTHTNTDILLSFAVTLIFFPVFVVLLVITQARINRFCNQIKENYLISFI